MTKTQNSKSRLLKTIGCIDMVGGLVLFYIGIRNSSSFIGGFALLIFSVPGLAIFITALTSLRSSTSLKKSHIPLALCTGFLALVSILALAGWYKNYSESRFYVNLYNNTRIGMTYDEVLHLANNKKGTCKPYLFNNKEMDCVWIDAVYSPGSSIVSGGNNYVEIVFNSNGFAISKNAPGH